MKKAIVFIIVSLIFQVVIAQEQTSYNVVEQEGVKYYEYVIEVGDGVWGISKKFDISQTDIYKANPWAELGLKVGQVLLIPVMNENISINTSTKNETDLVHVVLQKQTLYSISKIYGVTVDKLIELNPWADNGISVGDEIVISKKESGEEEVESSAEAVDLVITHEVMRKETLYSISKMYKIQIHDIISQNPQVEESGLKIGMILEIRKGDSEVDKVRNTEANKEDVETVSPVESKISRRLKNKLLSEKEDARSAVIAPVVLDTVVEQEDTMSVVAVSKFSETPLNIVVLLPFMADAQYTNISLKKYVDMYKGMLLSMEHQKKSGRSFIVNTYDTKKSKEVLDSLFTLKEVQEADMIIGPAYAEEVPFVLNFTKEKNIPCLVPIANNIADEFKYDNLVQFNPTLQNIVDDIYSDMFRNKNVKYIFAKTERVKNKGSFISQLLENKFKAENLEYSEFIISHDNVDTLTTLVAQDSAVLVFANSDPNQVKPLLQKINRLNLSRMSVFGYDNWKKEVLSMRPNTYYYSVFNDMADLTTYEFQYNKWYGYKEPNTVRAYDVIGYDIFTLAMDILVEPKASLYTNDISEDSYLQTVPNLYYENNKGYMNVRYYIYKFDGTQTVKIK